MLIWMDGKWHDPNEKFIGILMSSGDKRNVTNMSPDAPLIVSYPDAMTVEEAQGLVSQLTETDDFKRYKEQALREPKGG